MSSLILLVLVALNDHQIMDSQIEKSSISWRCSWSDARLSLPENEFAFLRMIKEALFKVALAFKMFGTFSKQNSKQMRDVWSSHSLLHFMVFIL